ncbi:MAG: OsmC family peroxiredoxin [Persephonella sp.]|nr:MAG: OsmC family peroxiredoxin [Persephonella sp.]RUM60707.1 MAG: OsmC family peroxiredoxin [Persephonella sp.]
MKKIAVIDYKNKQFSGRIEGKDTVVNLTETGLRATDFMLMSIGYCFGLTVEAYVNHKGYKIEDLQIKVIGKKHEKENRYENIKIEVSFKTDLPQDKIDRIMVIGKRGCTVSNTMLKTPEIETIYIAPNS